MIELHNLNKRIREKINIWNCLKFADTFVCPTCGHQIQKDKMETPYDFEERCKDHIMEFCHAY